MDVIKDFAVALLQARQAKKVTQEDIAWTLGLSQATYYAWECGHRLCPYKHIISLILYFDDDSFTRKMVRIFLSFHHQISGMDKMENDKMKRYYTKIRSLLSEEYKIWITEQ